MFKAIIVNGVHHYFELLNGKIVKEVSRETVENYKSNFTRHDAIIY